IQLLTNAKIMKLILIGDVFAVTFFEVFCDCLLLMENAFLECWHSHKTSPAFSDSEISSE
ncbi:MAG: hypothetical protein II076_08145, partial [Bacteroidales bacterium]|nr:hypothetical protein [Bacteroidales bacterium]